MTALEDIEINEEHLNLGDEFLVACTVYFAKLGKSAPQPGRLYENEIINGDNYVILSSGDDWLATVKIPLKQGGYKMVSRDDVHEWDSMPPGPAATAVLDELLAFPGVKDYYFQILDRTEEELIATVGPEVAARLLGGDTEQREQALIEELAPTSCTLVKVLGRDDAYYILTSTSLGHGSQEDILRFQSSDRLTLEQAEKWVVENPS